MLKLKRYKQRSLKIVLMGLLSAVAFDQLFNTASGGNEDETISERAARLRKDGVRWACVLCKLLNWLDDGHCP